MAEGGDCTSIQDGSDAYIAFTCTPCIEEGTREDAFKYCPECDEYLCSTCTKYHLKMKATRDHELVEGKDELKVASSETKIRCQQHRGRDIEMYCGTHDMVYCLMCIATEHRLCNDVTSLVDAAGSNFQHNEIDHLKEEFKSISNLLVVSESSKQQNLVIVKEKKNEIQRRVREIEGGMIQHIKNLSEEANTSLNQTYAKVKGELESEIAILNRSRSEVEKLKKQIQSATEEDQEHRFVQVKLCQKVLNDAKNQHTKFEMDGRLTIAFEENTGETMNFLEYGSFGKINEARVGRKREIKCQKEVNVRMKNDQSACRIIDICQLDSGVCILADTRNSKIKLLNTNLSVTDHFSFAGQPGGICRISQNEVAVKLSSDEIKILSVGTNISNVRSISIKQGGTCPGFAYLASKLWVSNENGIDMYDIKGTFEKSVSKERTGQKIFKSKPWQMTSYQNSVYAAGQSDGVVCFGSNGTKKAQFCDLLSTVGVCISNDGTVFAIDKHTRMIAMFSQDGECIGELIPIIRSKNVPESLCFDNKKNSILIGFYNSDTVTVLYLRSE